MSKFSLVSTNTWVVFMDTYLTLGIFWPYGILDVAIDTAFARWGLAKMGESQGRLE